MRFALAVSLTLVVTAAPVAQDRTVAFDSGRWTVLDPGGRLMPYLGRPSLYLEGGIAIVADANFGDGTIEFDVAIHGNAGFAGVVFRGESADDYELIYLRPHRSRQWDALQYTPIFAGQEAWQLYTGAGYNGIAEFPANRWVPVRLVVEGYTAKVYVDGAADPQLTVTDLKRPWARGHVGLWGRAGAANFSNVRVLTVDRAAPPSAPVSPPPAPGVITRWSLGPTVDAASVSLDRLPEGSIAWEPVRAESSGILNIARYRKKVSTVPRDVRESARDLVFTKAVLASASDQRVRLSFGYSDAVTIFLNGRPLYSGRAAYLERDGSFLGTLTLGPDTLFLDLVAGRNELVFAVSETFGGWGLAAKLDPSARVTVEP